MEPNMEMIDDYNGKESSKKRALVYGIIATILAVSAALTALKFQYDAYIPEAFNPVVVK